MTDFRQRQAISTLTAPAARGLTPHYLVQPGTRHALYPATGTHIHLSYTLYPSFTKNAIGNLVFLYTMKFNRFCALRSLLFCFYGFARPGIPSFDNTAGDYFVAENNCRKPGN